MELAKNYEPEFDKLAQALSRTLAGDVINDISFHHSNDIQN